MLTFSISKTFRLAKTLPENANVNEPLGLAQSKNRETSVTRLDDLLDFGELFKAFGNI